MPTIADLVDERTLRDLAGPPAYLEGATCAEHHCVTMVQSTPSAVTAEVQDTETYQTTLELAGNKLTWSCTCGQATIVKPCSHVVAVGVTVWREAPPRDGHPEDLERGRGTGLPKQW